MHYSCREGVDLKRGGIIDPAECCQASRDKMEGEGTQNWEPPEATPCLLCSDGRECRGEGLSPTFLPTVLSSSPGVQSCS